jgi:hypothetical protein
MSAKRNPPLGAWPTLMLVGLVGVGHAQSDEDVDQADIEFLEYLGSWEDSEEDWLIFAGDRETRDESDDEEKEETAPDGEKLAEVKDEE